MIAVVAFVVGAATGAPGSPEKTAANHFAEAWQARDFAAMYAELNDASKAAIELKQFAADYREARDVATLRGLVADSAEDARLRRRRDRGAGAADDQDGRLRHGRRRDRPALVGRRHRLGALPRLPRPAPRREAGSGNRTGAARPILAADGTPLAEGPADEREHPLGSAAIDVTGEIGEASEEEEPNLATHGFPPETPVGISGLERAFNRRLAGKPGGKLLAVAGNGAQGRQGPRPRRIEAAGRAPR